MKAIIEYDVSGDDKEDFDLMIQSRDMHLAVWKFINDDELREMIKRKCKNKKVEACDLMGIIMDRLRDIMDGLNVNLDILS